jgi:cation diffusion facilitator CzcD-associated flavoprotein CzcO
VDDVVIVGAGPAGLAAAAMLRAHQIDAVLLEREHSLAEPWRARYDRLHLHTIRWLSDLPGYGIPADFGRWVTRDNFVDYLDQYARHHRLEPQFGVEAIRIDRDNGRWLVRTSNGTIPTRVVVVASGYARVPNLPNWPGTFDGPVVHRLTTAIRRLIAVKMFWLLAPATAALTSRSISPKEMPDEFGSPSVRRRTSCRVICEASPSS